jgi:hypothetical protein
MSHCGFTRPKRMVSTVFKWSVGAWIRLLLKIVLFTLFAMAVWLFAVVTIQIGGIRSTSVSDAEFIRARNHVCLVSTDWVSPKGDIFEWLQAEARARMAVIALIWLAAVVFAAVQHFWSREPTR